MQVGPCWAPNSKPSTAWQACRVVKALTTFLDGVPEQSFAWAVENDQWHARVGSIPMVFAAAAADMGKEKVDAEVVRAVWSRLLPGLLEVRPLSLCRGWIFLLDLTSKVLQCRRAWHV